MPHHQFVIVGVCWAGCGADAGSIAKEDVPRYLRAEA